MRFVFPNENPQCVKTVQASIQFNRPYQNVALSHKPSLPHFEGQPWKVVGWSGPASCWVSGLVFLGCYVFRSFTILRRKCTGFMVPSLFFTQFQWWCLDRIFGASSIIKFAHSFEISKRGPACESNFFPRSNGCVWLFFILNGLHSVGNRRLLRVWWDWGLVGLWLS